MCKFFCGHSCSRMAADKPNKRRHYNFENVFSAFHKFTKQDFFCEFIGIYSHREHDPKTQMFKFTYSLRNKRSGITKALLHSDLARIGTIAKKFLLCLLICSRSKLRTYKMRKTPFVRERLQCRLA